MNKKSILAIMLVICFVFGIMAVSAGAITLTGINDPALNAYHPNLSGVKCTRDVAQVQNAVNNGGTVTLSGTFEFGSWDKLIGTGESGTVFITNDVTISGDATAKIKGGYRTFTVGLPARPWHYNMTDDESNNSFTDVIPVNAVIKNIRFEKPMLFAIFVAASKGLEVSGCSFFDAKPLIWSRWGGVPRSGSIHVNPISFIGGTLPGKITGNIMIKNNVIDGNAKRYAPGTQPASAVPFAGVYWDGMQTGMSFFGTGNLNTSPPSDMVSIATANVLISSNEVRNFMHVGIYLSATQGNVMIDSNIIKPGTNNFSGIGIQFLEAGIYGEGDPSKTKLTASNNTIIQTGSGDDAIYIDSATDAVISGNHITANNYWSGIGLWGCSGSLINQNNIDGSAPAAMLLYGDDVNNTFQANNLPNFTPDPSAFGIGAHYVLFEGANYNTVVGYIGDIVLGNGTIIHHNAIDQGANNTMTGLTKYVNIGQAVKDAMQKKIETKKALKRL